MSEEQAKMILNALFFTQSAGWTDTEHKQRW